MKIVADAIAVIGAISGSTIIALNIGMNQFGFVLFLLSSLATLFLLHNSNASKSIELITFYFLITNVIGLIRA